MKDSIILSAFAFAWLFGCIILCVTYGFGPLWKDLLAGGISGVFGGTFIFLVALLADDDE